MDPGKLSQLVDYWANSSDSDYVSAENILTKASEYVHSLFFLHLSIEKALKAVYVHQIKKHAPLSHNLIYLAKEAGIDLSDEHLNLLVEINEFNLETRYPSHSDHLKKKITHEMAVQYFQKGQTIRKWILKKSNKS